MAGRERGILKPGRNTKLTTKRSARSGNRLDFFISQSQAEGWGMLEIEKAGATKYLTKAEANLFCKNNKSQRERKLFVVILSKLI